ncbi:CoxG family protein [Ottowia sp.]|uniref:CoxG family protein n=1 Tax=Ottowia sp. TaxID=1898956 RepID=UPI0039647C54
MGRAERPRGAQSLYPGCDSIEATGENAYALVNAIKVGPVSAKFKGAIQLADIQAPSSYTIQFEGNGGAAGFGKGSAKVVLTPKDAGCELGHTVNATVGGKIAQVGQRLIDGVAKSMAESFFKRFGRGDAAAIRRPRRPPLAKPCRPRCQAAKRACRPGCGFWWRLQSSWRWVGLCVEVNAMLVRRRALAPSLAPSPLWGEGWGEGTLALDCLLLFASPVVLRAAKLAGICAR